MFTSSYLTLAGEPFDGTAHAHLPRCGALKRAQAAHEVGITSMGIRWDEPLSTDLLRYVQTPELEWWDTSLPPSREFTGRLVMLAHTYGITRLNIGYSGKRATPLWQVAKNVIKIAELCERLHITVNVEPVVFGSAFRSLSQVCDLLMYCDYPENVGLLYDMYHVDYGAQTERWGDWRDLPEGKVQVTEIQVCGNRQRYDLAHPWEESQNRPYAADSFDTTADVLEYLTWKYPNAALSYELPNEGARNGDLKTMAEAASEDMRRLS